MFVTYEVYCYMLSCHECVLPLLPMFLEEVKLLIIVSIEFLMSRYVKVDGS